ncbi:GbsR/MarR family transcriptional regulator [Planotetraspora thailandica]|nr:MarR family transcriptional regulator [Planotetraspora thailandica]
MTTAEELAFTDRMANFYAREYGFPPVAGRVLGYLLVCRPPQQTIAEISEALLASRSAITGAVALLSSHNVVRRSRSAGQRVDHVTLDPRALDPAGFAGETYKEQAALAREALDLLGEGPSERRSMLEEAAAFYDFMAERMPALLTEWHTRRDVLRRRR